MRLYRVEVLDHRGRWKGPWLATLTGVSIEREVDACFDKLPVPSIAWNPAIPKQSWFTTKGFNRFGKRVVDILERNNKEYRVLEMDTKTEPLLVRVYTDAYQTVIVVNDEAVAA